MCGQFVLADCCLQSCANVKSVVFGNVHSVRNGKIQFAADVFILNLLQQMKALVHLINQQLVALSVDGVIVQGTVVNVVN